MICLVLFKLNICHTEGSEIVLSENENVRWVMKKKVSGRVEIDDMQFVFRAERVNI